MNTTAQLLETSIRQTADTNTQLITDANLDLERKLVSKETDTFRASITSDHSLYAVTLTPSRRDIIKLRLNLNEYDCTKYVQNLVTELLHLFHKNCHNNYSRNESRLTRFFAQVEFENKQHSDKVAPHTHACFAIHPDYLDQFEDLLIPHTKQDLDSKIQPEDPLTIDFDRLKQQTKAQILESKIASIHIRRLKIEDLLTWSSYCFKEQTHSLQLRQRVTY